MQNTEVNETVQWLCVPMHSRAINRDCAQSLRIDLDIVESNAHVE